MKNKILKHARAHLYPRSGSAGSSEKVVNKEAPEDLQECSAFLDGEIVPLDPEAEGQEEEPEVSGK